MNAVQSRNSKKCPFGSRERTGSLHRSAEAERDFLKSEKAIAEAENADGTKRLQETTEDLQAMKEKRDRVERELSEQVCLKDATIADLEGRLAADLCSLPVLSLLPNGRFSELLDCTAFISCLKAQQSPKNLDFGNEKLDIRGIPVLNPQLDDFTFLLGDTPILDDFRTTRCRNNDAV